MTADDDRSPDSFTRDLPDATSETVARGLAAVSARRKARQEARDEYWSGETEFRGEHRTALALNRAAALRGPVGVSGVDHWWAVCVCRWRSLQFPDPELALREYDRHPCSIPLEDDAPMRAQRDLNNFKLVERADGSIGMAKRPTSTIIPAIASQRSKVDEQALRGTPEELQPTATTQTVEDEDAVAQRMSLLELK